MQLKITSKQKFDSDSWIPNLYETKQYRVVFLGHRITKDSPYVMKIHIYDKSMQLVGILPFKYLAFEKVLVKQNEDILAVVCPESHSVVIVNLVTEDQAEVTLPSFDENNYQDELYPSLLYWWDGNCIFVLTVFKRLYCIDIIKLTATIGTLQLLEQECYKFYEFLQLSVNYGNVEWIDIYNGRFTYSAENKIGFIDLKNNLHHSVTYSADDIHTIYFYNNTFIIIHCYTIDLVKKDSIQIDYKLLENSSSEMKHSLFVPSMGELTVISDYWRKSTRYSTLLHFVLEKEQSY